MKNLPDRNIAKMDRAETLNYCRQFIPNVRIVSKQDSPLMKLIGAVMFWNRSFMSNYITTLYNAFTKTVTIYAPYGEVDNDTIWHEIMGHGVDWRKHPVWFPLSYLLALPVGITMRSYWEFKGYRWNIVYEYHRTGKVTDGFLEWIGSQFWGPSYLYMLPFKGLVMKVLRRYRDEAMKMGRPAE